MEEGSNEGDDAVNVGAEATVEAGTFETREWFARRQRTVDGGPVVAQPSTGAEGRLGDALVQTRCSTVLPQELRSGLSS